MDENIRIEPQNLALRKLRKVQPRHRDGRYVAVLLGANLHLGGSFMVDQLGMAVQADRPRDNLPALLTEAEVDEMHPHQRARALDGREHRHNGWLEVICIRGKGDLHHGGLLCRHFEPQY